MLEPVYIYSYVLPGCRAGSRSCSSPHLLVWISPLGGYLKNICTYFKSLNLVCGKWLLKQPLNYFIRVFAEGLLQIFGTKLRFLRPFITFWRDFRRRKKNQGVLNYYSLCAARTNRIDCGLGTGKKYLHSCMAIIFMCVKIMSLLFCPNIPEWSFGRMAWL